MNSMRGLMACLCLLVQLPADGRAQNYPVKPVRYLVAFSAGSGADTIGRIVAAGMSQTLGVQVVVENRTGAAGNIAAEVAAKSVAELVKLARARPGALNYASTGAGSATFLAGEMFKSQAGVDLLHVPYRGGGEALTAQVSPSVISVAKDSRSLSDLAPTNS